MEYNPDDFTIASVEFYSGVWFRIANIDRASFPRSGDIFDQRPIFGDRIWGLFESITKLK